MRTDNLYALSPDLPVPMDEGACDHLTGAAVPPRIHASACLSVSLPERWCSLVAPAVATAIEFS
jgi:hypothetical protein